MLASGDFRSADYLAYTEMFNNMCNESLKKQIFFVRLGSMCLVTRVPR